MYDKQQTVEEQQNDGLCIRMVKVGSDIIPVCSKKKGKKTKSQ